MATATQLLEVMAMLSDTTMCHTLPPHLPDARVGGSARHNTRFLQSNALVIFNYADDFTAMRPLQITGL